MRLVLAVLLLALAFPAGASAHAVLESTVPERGASLEEAPATVELRFSEAVEAAFGSLQVYDSAGERVDRGGVLRPDGPRTVGVALDPERAEGGLTVIYRVISADSHPVSGGFVFSAGDGAAPGATVDELLAGASAGPVTTTALAAARAVSYAAIALGIGVLAFLALCWIPGLRAAADGSPRWDAARAAFARRTRTLLVAAALAGIVSGAAALVTQGANAAGTTAWAALDVSTIEEVAGTRFGTAYLAGIGAWVALLALLALRARPALLALPLAPVAMIPALSGHAATDLVLGVLVTLHVLAISAWVGGVAVLVLALRTATSRLEGDERTRLLAATVARFSALAGIAVAIVLGTGVVQSLLGMDEVGQVTGTAYGRATTIKLALFLGLVWLGWVNRSRLLPRLRAAATGTGTGEAGRVLRRVLRAELAIAVVVLGVTGALAGYPPPDSLAAGPFSGSADTGPARVEVTVDPARPGPNEIHLYYFDRGTGAQWDVPKEVRLEAELPERGLERIEIDATKAGPGHYVASGAVLGPPGDWTLHINTRVTEFDELTARLTIPIEE